MVTLFATSPSISESLARRYLAHHDRPLSPHRRNRLLPPRATQNCSARAIPLKLLMSAAPSLLRDENGPGSLGGRRYGLVS
jgi:hypothetical protein